MAPTTKKIIQGIKNGDMAILKYLYSSLFFYVKNDIVNNSGTGEDAKDIFQDTIFDFYLKARINRLNIRNKFQPYFLRACHNSWLSTLSKKKKELKFYRIESSNTTGIFEIEQELGDNEANKYKLFDKYIKTLSKICQALINLYRDRFDETKIIQILDLKDQATLCKKRFDCQKALCKRIMKDPNYKKIICS